VIELFFGKATRNEAYYERGRASRLGKME